MRVRTATLTRVVAMSSAAALVAGLVTFGFPSPASATTTDVATAGDFTTAASACADGDVIRLTAAITTGNVTVACSAAIDLNDNALGTGALTIAAGKTLTIRDTSAGGGGVLTADARPDSANFRPGIGTVGASLVIESGRVAAFGDDAGAGIGGSSGAGAPGAITIRGAAVVQATGGSSNGAGIGGGAASSGGTVLIEGDANVTAAGGGTAAAGIGGGNSGSGGNVTVQGNATVTATGGGDGAGIGSGAGYGSSGGTFVTAGTATVTATGGTFNPASGQFIGAAGIGGGADGSGGNVTIGAGTTVTATPGFTSGGNHGGQASAVGGGAYVVTFPPTFGTLTVNGTLRVPSGQLRTLTASDEVQVGSTGVITGTVADATVGASIVGPGSINNGGSIQLSDARVVGNGTTVKDHHYLVSFDTQGGSANPADVKVFASTFNKGVRTFPPDPTKAGSSFLGWNTATDGSGTGVNDADAVIPGSSDGTAALSVPLYAQWLVLQNATSTAVSCVPTSLAVGDSTTCTATVTDTDNGSITPTGDVDFGFDTCTLSSGSCSVSFVPSADGQQTVTGAYGGDATHLSSSGSDDITALLRSTSTSVTCAPASIVVLESTTCTATVTDTDTGTTSTPTGTVDFEFDSCTLSSGSCSVTFAPIASGSRSLAAGYGGDATHDTSLGESNQITVAARSTGTSVTCSPESLNVGQSTTCTATVTDTDSGTGYTPTGTVDFGFDTCTLSSGSCAVSFAPTSAGSTTVTGTYTGDGAHDTSAGSDDITAGVRATSTSVSCTPSDPVVGQSTMCTATVADADTGTTSTPTGFVSFSGGRGSCTLSGGVCGVMFTPTATGTETVTATFDGDATHSGSDGSDEITVWTRLTATSVSCSPTDVVVGASTTCTATVDDSDTGTASTPTGSVSFGGRGSCMLTAGACSVTFAPSVVGVETVTASYAGDAAHDMSMGGATVTTGLRATSTVVSCSPGSPVVDESTTCTATVSDTTSSPTTPSGSVDFGSRGTCVLSSGSCSVTFAPVATGSETLTGAYGGDSAHATSSGSDSVTVSKRATSTVVSCSPASPVLAESTSCTATVSDTSTGTSSTPTGSVSFGSRGSCPLSGGACSVSFAPTVTGSETVTGAYSGDTKHAASSNSDDVTVARRATSTSVSCSPSNPLPSQSTTCTATVSDTSLGTASTPTGSVDFGSRGSCTLSSGACSVTFSPTAAGSETVAGSYSGDATHAGSSGSTTLAVGKTTPALTDSPSTSARIGSPMSDAATLTGESPTGTIRFTLYGPNDSACSGTPAFVADVSVSGNGSYSSGGFTPVQPGVYRWVVRYSGDDANNGVAISCANATLVTVGRYQTSIIATESHLFIPFLTWDTARVTGFAPTGAVTFKLYPPSDSLCTGRPYASQTVSFAGLLGSPAPPSISPTTASAQTLGIPLLARGVWRWTASYPGDARNEPVSTPCGAAEQTFRF